MRCFAAALALSALAACDPSAMATGSTSRQTVSVAGREVTVAAPSGLCIDAPSTRVEPLGAFLLLKDCGATAATGLAMTASVSSHGLGGSGPATEATLASLRRYLDTPQGRAMAGRSGRAGGVRIVADQVSGDVLFVLVEDRGPQPIAGLDRQFWRAILEVNGRMTVLSALGFGPVPPDEELTALAAFASSIRAANPA